MEIKIDVDETKFDEVLKDELKALTPEELHRVVIDCIGEYLRKDNYSAIDKLVFYQNHTWSDKSPTDFSMKLIQDCDYSALQDIVDKIIERLSENHKDMLNKVLLNAITDGLTNTYSFQQTLGNAISHAIFNYDQSKK